MSLTLEKQRPIFPLPTIPVSRQVALLAQLQSNWCWAACIQMVQNYYYPAQPVVYQCGIVNGVLGRNDCCGNPCPGACNVPLLFASMPAALQAYGLLYAWYNGALPLNSVQLSILNNRVVEAGLVWTAGGGHFILVIGYDTANTNVLVNDPWYGQFSTTYNYVLSGYGQGTWSYSYVTTRTN